MREGNNIFMSQHLIRREIGHIAGNLLLINRFQQIFSDDQFASGKV